MSVRHLTPVGDCGLLIAWKWEELLEDEGDAETDAGYIPAQ